MTDTQFSLGKIISEPMAQRDAVHIAVAPVVAGDRLAPGQPIGFVGETVGVSAKPIGIVDPFLSGPVFKGDRFYMFLFPNTIMSLRHNWTHPAFDDRSDVGGPSAAWLRSFADAAGLSYDDLLAGAADYLDNGEYLIQGGRWEGFSTPPEFWDHYEAVTNRKVPAEDRGGFFSCSC